MECAAHRGVANANGPRAKLERASERGAVLEAPGRQVPSDLLAADGGDELAR